MRRSLAAGVAGIAVLVVACSTPVPNGRPPPAELDSGVVVDAGGMDVVDAPAEVGPVDAPAEAEAGDACEWGGAPGTCMTSSDCTALGGHTSFAGECPGPASIECCIVTPSVADNPPTPAGWALMQQSQVTPAMTTWAVAILNAPATYPMFSTTTMMFGTLDVLARVEWHPPDFQNSVVHRGVTLYEPAD